MKTHPMTEALVASMKPGEHRKIASDQTMVISRDGLSCYVLTNNDHAHPYLHTCAEERDRVEQILGKGATK
jgi:hypothetical protein